MTASSRGWLRCVGCREVGASTARLSSRGSVSTEVRVAALVVDGEHGDDVIEGPVADGVEEA